MEGEIIICIAPRKWDSLWRSTQQIMSRFAARNQVIYFEPGRNPDKPVLPEMRRNFSNFFKIQIREVHRNVLAVPTPPNLPLVRQLLPRSALQISMPLVVKINAWVEILHVRRTMEALDIHSPILWLFDPYQIDFIGKFGEKLTCYHNYDEFANFIQNSRIRDLVRHLDDELCRRVDVVFTTSRSQWEHRRSFNPNTYCVPNGVDFDLFNKALNPKTPVPLDMVGIKKPVIGYVGWLAHQMDLNLLLGVAEAYPDYSLVLVGPDVMPNNVKHRRLQTFHNVYFLGQKSRDSLPEYLKAMDVVLIPYLLEGYVLTAYPLKLHEYLAAGRSIVSTALPELHPYSRVVRIAETPVEFISQIRQALQDYSPQAVDARLAVARENTWDNRVLDVYRALQPFLSDREEPEQG